MCVYMWGYFQENWFTQLWSLRNSMTDNPEAGDPGTLVAWLSSSSKASEPRKSLVYLSVLLVEALGSKGHCLTAHEGESQPTLEVGSSYRQHLCIQEKKIWLNLTKNFRRVHHWTGVLGFGQKKMIPQQQENENQFVFLCVCMWVVSGIDPPGPGQVLSYWVLLFCSAWAPADWMVPAHTEGRSSPLCPDSQANVRWKRPCITCPEWCFTSSLGDP